MNRDDIIRMAREAGLVLGYPFLPEHLERFAHLVVAHERDEAHHAKTEWPITQLTLGGDLMNNALYNLWVNVMSVCIAAGAIIGLLVGLLAPFWALWQVISLTLIPEARAVLLDADDAFRYNLG